MWYITYCLDTLRRACNHPPLIGCSYTSGASSRAVAPRSSHVICKSCAGSCAGSCATSSERSPARDCGKKEMRTHANVVRSGRLGRLGRLGLLALRYFPKQSGSAHTRPLNPFRTSFLHLAGGSVWLECVRGKTEPPAGHLSEHLGRAGRGPQQQSVRASMRK